MRNNQQPFVHDILIVDDTPENLTVLRQMLAEQNYMVRPAINGEIAIQAVNMSSPDLILLDIKMPGMDGYEVCKQLKSEEKTRRIPVIFISALNELDDKIKAFSLGGVDYITKPFQVEEVLARVETHLMLNHMQKQVEEQNVRLRHEITDRKQAEDALRESEERYRLLVENANEAIFIIEDGVVKFPNFKTEEMTGYSEKELSEIPFINIIHPDDREMVLERRRKRLLGEKTPSIYSFRMNNKSGDELLVQINAVLITWEGKPATINFIRDITEQKRLEAQLQQAQKMESMGTLAGGIAHDFNNLLMGIQGRASLMQMDIDSSNPHFEHLKGIGDYVKSAAELTKQLLGFARGGKYEVKTTDLNEFIKKQNRMFGRTRKEITIRGRYEKNLWTTEIDQGQIEQVLLNIYVNAWHAMPGGGDLFIQTENVMIEEHYIKPYQVEPGRYIKISITDTGVGMDEATRQRIFDPFFTTKEMGRGTGLGLASAYGIIKNHKGFINVYSEKGEGTTFNVYFPASKKEAVKEKEKDEELIRGTETVFLVDDEDIILDVGQGIIEKLGYKVLTAKSGKEAIGIYEKNHDRIDMVILDMIMPEMGGGETYDKLKETNTDIKVLLSSGYSINGQATEILERGCNGFIQKPFNIGELSKKIREILDKE